MKRKDRLRITDLQSSRMSQAAPVMADGPTPADSGNALADFCKFAGAISRPVVVTNDRGPDHPIIFANEAYLSLTGYERSEIDGKDCRMLQGADTDSGTVTELRRAISRSESIRRTILNYRKDGQPFWNDLTIDPIRDDAGRTLGYAGLLSDVTESQLALEASRATQTALENVLRHVPGYFYQRVLKPDGELQLPYVSPSINHFLGLPDDIHITKEVFDQHVHPEDFHAFREGIMKSARSMARFDMEFRLVAAGGEVRWFRSDAEPRRLSNGDIVWSGMSLEITEAKLAKERLEFLSFHDPVTGLANRDQLRLAALHAISLSRSAMAPVHVFAVDLMSFQEVNDALGRRTGDVVLRHIGQRLADFTAAQSGTAARVGGDEFFILLTNVAPGPPAEAMAKEIGQIASQAVHVGSDGEVRLDVAIGYAAYPFGEETADSSLTDIYEELLKRADLALHAAKQHGPQSYVEYSADLDDRTRHRMLIRQSLHRAITEAQFELHYQPIVQLQDGNIIGAEALIRWKHPQLGLQRPDLFIPIAEETGLIVPLGAWIMQEAMRQRAAWRSERITLPRLAINVSGAELKRPSFAAMVEQSLAAANANPHEFELELTEGLLIEASPSVLAALGHLRSIGFRITIDDFGTGHSTFKYLRDFQVDKIKIDQTFVRHLVVGSKDAAIIRSMISLSRDLGIEIVAEGVENSIQRDFLLSEGCHVGQGYYYSTPLPAAEFGRLCRNGRTLPQAREKDIQPRTFGRDQECHLPDPVTPR